MVYRILFFVMLGISLQSQWNYSGWSASSTSDTLYITYYEITYNTPDTTYAIDSFSVAGVSGDPYYPNGINNTGLSYNRKDTLLYSAGYYQNSSSIIEFIGISGTLSNSVDSLNITSYVDYLQGVAYDESDSSFFVWGRPKGVSDVYKIYHINKNGVPVDSVETTPRQGGSLERDRINDRLWTKSYIPNGDWVYIYDCSDLSLVDSIDTNILGEGLTIDYEDDAFWIGTDQYIYKLKRNGATGVTILATYDNPTYGDANGGEIEGLVLDERTRLLYMNSDEWIHGFIPNGNRTWVLNPEQEYNSKVRFPYSIPFEYFLLTDAIANETLNGGDGSVALSPIIDFGAYSSLTGSLTGNASIEYRGSDSAPSTTATTYFLLDFYDANNSNDGWGTTTPDIWQSTIPSNRYIQIKFVSR